MIRRLLSQTLLLGLSLLAVPAQAQLANPSSDLIAEVDRAVAAVTPQACPVPLADTIVGSAGVAPVCMTRPDATRPTVIQAKTTVTTQSATWSVTWDRTFPTPPIYTDARIYGAGDPYLCTVLVATETGANGKCYQLVATTLPSAVTSLTNLVVSPFAAAGAGLTVKVVARQ